MNQYRSYARLISWLVFKDMWRKQARRNFEAGRRKGG